MSDVPLYLHEKTRGSSVDVGRKALSFQMCVQNRCSRRAFPSGVVSGRYSAHVTSPLSTWREAVMFVNLISLALPPSGGREENRGPQHVRAYISV